MSEALRDLLLRMHGYFLKPPRNNRKTLIEEVILVGAMGLIILDIITDT